MFELQKKNYTSVCGISAQIIEVGELRITVEGHKSSRGRSTTTSFKVLEFFKNSRIVKSSSGVFQFRFPVRGAGVSGWEYVELLDFSDEIIQALRGCTLTAEQIPGVSNLSLSEKNEVLQLLFDDQPKVCSVVKKKQPRRCRQKNVNYDDCISDGEELENGIGSQKYSLKVLRKQSSDEDFEDVSNGDDSEEEKWSVREERKQIVRRKTVQQEKPQKQAQVDKESLTDLEKFRLQNIERNKQRLAELNIFGLSTKMFEKQPTPKSQQQPQKRKKPQKPDNIQLCPARSSKRIKGLKPDGTAPKEGESQFYYSPGPQQLPEQDLERHSTQSFQLKEKLDDSEQKVWQEIYSSLQSNQNIGSGVNKDKNSVYYFQNQDQNLLNYLTLDEDSVQKVTAKGITVLEFCPLVLENFCVLAAGDKIGNLSLWKFDNFNEDGGNNNVTKNKRVNSEQIINLDVHKKFISGLSWSTFEKQKLFTCSYDGSIRALDVEKQESFAQFSSKEDMFSGFDLWDEKSTGIVATYDGYLKFLDFREKDLIVNEFELHSRKINCVHLEPVSKNKLVTCCNDASVMVWDMRKMQDKTEKVKQQKLFEVVHARSCQSGYFSPDGSGRILTTSYDDKLRVWAEDGDGDGMKQVFSIKHDNQTGRWVTPFRAVWAPCGKSILCGDMKRAINVYDLDFENNSFENSANLCSEYMTAIPSRMCVNKWYPIIAAATSSGRIHMYTPC